MPLMDYGIISDAGFCLISAFITCGLGFFVYAQKTSSTVHRLFFATMISAAYWALGEFFIWQAARLDGVSFWLKFSSFWPLTIAFGSHFILEFTGAFPDTKKRRSIMAFIYIAAIVLSFIGLFTDSLYIAEFSPGIGYFYLPACENFLCVAEILYTASIMFAALYLGFVSWKYTKTETEHSRNRLLFAGIISVVFFGVLSGILLPVLKIYIPNLVFFGFVVMSVFTAYAIRHYGLFVLSPETAVPEIMKTMPDGLILFDINGDIVAANESAESIFSSLNDFNAAKNAKTLVSSEDYEAIRTAISETGEVSDYEISLPGETGRYISISGAVVSDRNGRPSGSVFIARDITERKASENALRVVNNKLSLFSRLTCHDISNLVTVLSGNLDLLGEMIKDAEEKRFLDKSVEITDRIMKQIEFSRSYQDIGSEKPLWINPEESINGAREGLVHGKVRIMLKINHVLIYADPLLEKVFYNLIENAIRHGEKITEIVISTEEQEDSSLILRIKDDGNGIPDDEKEKIFSYNFGKNTGFGLAFVREILSVTGIEIYEKGVFGEGASFEMHIPKDGWKKAA